MFKKSRTKIVLTIMSILIALWVGTLTIIYTSSYIEMTRQNDMMLEAHAEIYSINKDTGLQPVRPLPDRNNRNFNSGFEESNLFRLTTFYTVAIGFDGNLIEIKNERTDVHSDDELISLAKEIISNGKQRGQKANFSFYFTEKSNYKLVVFMDNTIINENASTLFRYTLIFGAVALIVFYFISVFLARKIVEPLEDSYKKQKQFISDAGHELKTPVSVVNANAELLSREIGENAWLSNIQYENERMGILVAQLLDLARTEDVSPQKEQLDLSRLCCGEALPFEGVAFESGITLHYEIDDGIMINGNSTQLKQLVSILLDNAIRHSDGDFVKLCLKKEHNFACLSVINCGKEIPAEQKSSLFERFYRTDNVRNSEDNHYGLGLAIAKAIVTSHNGKINVHCYDGLVEFRVKIPI